MEASTSLPSAAWNSSTVAAAYEAVCEDSYNVASTVVLSALIGLVCVVTITGNTSSSSSLSRS